ncbi:NUDIX family hydrolase [Podospora australis]|uniref:NUDIX family hydrolase n=1 Tax=Podospora australis TaxID=1536484 RepID=A0AAN6WQW1_9PEZI|nr:NUDIX family hydrolase [Podospora australis]
MPILLPAIFRAAVTRVTSSSLPLPYFRKPLSSSFTSPNYRTMSSLTTFDHPEHRIPITLPQGLSQEQVLQFHPFKSWLSTLTTSLANQHASPSHPFHKDPYKLHSITIQSFDLFGGSRVGFLKLQSDVRNSAGEWLPGAVFLRGPSVAMLVILMPDDFDNPRYEEANFSPEDMDGFDEEKYVLLTVQPRIAAGSLEFVELPAGMVDEEGNFRGAAAKEIEEELGMKISADELTCMSDLVPPAAGSKGEEVLPRGVFPSPGACDEFIQIFTVTKLVPRETLDEWTGKLTGLRDHGEKITLKLIRMKDLWKEGARDGKTLAAVAQWEKLRRFGLLNHSHDYNKS